MTRPLYVIRRDHQGMGGFLAPPGHWNLEYTLEGYYGGRRKQHADSLSGIEYALADESGASEAVRQQVRAIISAAQLADSDLWERHVYGYFRNCYASPDMDRDVSRSIQDRDNALPPDRHLAVLCIRGYFPDHQPRLDLIRDPGHGYGMYPCLKCGKGVQYEARLDKLAAMAPGGHDDPACPQGGDHEN